MENQSLVNITLDVFLILLTYLDDVRDVYNLSLVNKHFFNASNRKIVWARFVEDCSDLWHTPQMVAKPFPHRPSGLPEMCHERKLAMCKMRLLNNYKRNFYTRAQVALPVRNSQFKFGYTFIESYLSNILLYKYEIDRNEQMNHQQQYDTQRKAYLELWDISVVPSVKISDLRLPARLSSAYFSVIDIKREGDSNACIILMRDATAPHFVYICKLVDSNFTFLHSIESCKVLVWSSFVEINSKYLVHFDHIEDYHNHLCEIKLPPGNVLYKSDIKSQLAQFVVKDTLSTLNNTICYRVYKPLTGEVSELRQVEAMHCDVTSYLYNNRLIMITHDDIDGSRYCTIMIHDINYGIVINVPHLPDLTNLSDGWHMVGNGCTKFTRVKGFLEVASPPKFLTLGNFPDKSYYVLNCDTNTFSTLTVNRNQPYVRKSNHLAHIFNRTHPILWELYIPFKPQEDYWYHRTLRTAVMSVDVKKEGFIFFW